MSHQSNGAGKMLPCWWSGEEWEEAKEQKAGKKTSYRIITTCNAKIPIYSPTPLLLGPHTFAASTHGHSAFSFALTTLPSSCICPFHFCTLTIVDNPKRQKTLHPAIPPPPPSLVVISSSKFLTSIIFPTMHSRLAVFLSSLLLFTTALTSPVPEKRAPEFHLRTKVVNTTCDIGTKKDGLYVVAYHTGAGLNDVALLSNVTLANKGFFNGTNLQFDFGTEFPWGMELGYEPYAGWSAVEINTGLGSGGFFTDVNGVEGASEFSFGGWLACDWWHGVPQLFYLLGGVGYENYRIIPKTCSQVILEPVSI